MPIDLAALIAPAHTAFLTCECQNGVIGAGSLLPELAASARQTVIPNAARMARAARSVGVPVVHCVVGRRADDRGSNRNARLFVALMHSDAPFVLGTSQSEVVPEIGVEPSDFVLGRIHGLAPMSGTDLDPILRNLGVRTIVGAGVSVNVAIQNLVFDAINRGYQFVLPRDAVAGFPPSYAEAVIDNTLSLLATVVTTDDVLAVWDGRGR